MDALDVNELEPRILDQIRSELGRMNLADDDDLFQEAWLALLDRWPHVVRTYDPQRGCWPNWIRKIVHNIGSSGSSARGA